MERWQLPGLIDWTGVMAQPRYAGGHHEVMANIFGASAEVLASWIEVGYQGEEIWAYQFRDNTVALIQDSFGSCSGCDAWEANEDNDKAIANMIQSLVDSARLFSGIPEALEFARSFTPRAGEDEYNWDIRVEGEIPMDGPGAEDYLFRHAWHLVPELEQALAGEVH